MLIVCPSCATSYDVELASLGRRGRSVRCVRCREVWHAAPSRADKLFAAAAALAPERAVAEDTAQPAGETAAEPAAASPAAAAGQTTWFEPPADEPQNGEPRDAEPDPASAAAEDAAFAAEPNNSAEVDAPPIVPVDLDEGRTPIDIGADNFVEHRAEPRADIETIAARGRRRGAQKRRPRRWPLSRLQSGILALLLIDAIFVGWRGDFVRALPQTASFYAMIGLPVNLRGLAFDGVATRTEQHEGVPILVVEGHIVNAAGKVVDVPRLKFIVRNAAREEIYSWTAVASRPVLPPGEALSFRSRLASPPPEARDVVVRFVNRRDIVAATR